MIGTCENCKRSGRGIKQHHMVCRCEGGTYLPNNRIKLCSLCERFLHYVYTTPFLSQQLNTIDNLKDHREFRVFGTFLRDKDLNMRHRRKISKVVEEFRKWKWMEDE